MGLYVIAYHPAMICLSVILIELLRCGFPDCLLCAMCVPRFAMGFCHGHAMQFSSSSIMQIRLFFHGLAWVRGVMSCREMSLTAFDNLLNIKNRRCNMYFHAWVLFMIIESLRCRLVHSAVSRLPHLMHTFPIEHLGGELCIRLPVSLDSCASNLISAFTCRSICLSPIATRSLFGAELRSIKPP